MERTMIIQGNWNVFLNLAGEKLLLVRRKHPVIVIFPVILTSILLLFFSVIFYIFFIQVFFSLSLFLGAVFLTVSSGVSIMIKLIVDWYFHFYIVTNRRLMEVCYSPLASLVINDVLLDKINCTEIDIHTHGFFGELIDNGDVAIVFDRPTHQEEFILQDVYACSQIGRFLTEKILQYDNNNSDRVHTIWVRPRLVK